MAVLYNHFEYNRPFNMRIFRELNKIFPVWPVLIMNYPLVAGLFIQAGLVTFRAVLINVLWLGVFVILYRWVRSVRLYRVVVALVSVMAVVETLNWVFQKGPFSTASLFIVSATDVNESTDFLHAVLGWHFLLLIPLGWLIFKAWRAKPDFEHSRFLSVAYGVVLLVFAGFVFDNVRHNRLVRLGVPNFVKTLIFFEQEMRAFKETKGRDAFVEVRATPTENAQTVVLVMGESSNRNHWSLYGTDVPTTPLLQGRDDLYVFDNVISAYSETIGSVMISLSERALDNELEMHEGADVFDVFRSAGYATHWISNQSPIGVYENVITLLAKKADYRTYVNLSAGSSFESTLTRSYDERLLEPLGEALQMGDSLKFIVVHTMGNHTSYKKRYPPAFAKFKGKDSKRERTIAEYHNSLLYHDFVLDAMLDVVEKYASNAVVIYTADHGENVYDEGGAVGHGYSGRMPKSNVEIPFFIWTSEVYEKNSDFVPDEERLSAPFVTDHLFHTLIDLAKINTPIFIPEKSVVNPRFDATRKRVLQDGYDYDEGDINEQ